MNLVKPKKSTFQRRVRVGYPTVTSTLIAEFNQAVILTNWDLSFPGKAVTYDSVEVANTLTDVTKAKGVTTQQLNRLTSRFRI